MFPGRKANSQCSQGSREEARTLMTDGGEQFTVIEWPIRKEIRHGCFFRFDTSLHTQSRVEPCPAHDIRPSTSVYERPIVSWISLFAQPYRLNDDRSSCLLFRPGFAAVPVRHPSCPPRYTYGIAIYYFIATPTCWSPFETTSPIPVCATETGIPGFSLCPPVSVRQSQPAPCASLPPMQGQSPLLVHP